MRSKTLSQSRSGIPHIEDLPPQEFIDTIHNISNMRVSEKLDGSNLKFGFDLDGRFYTSREAKGGIDRFFSVDDYSDRPADNGFKAAHAALQQVIPQLSRIMDEGDAIEVEVLFGRQPNAIVYGSNYIAFLRVVLGDNGNFFDQANIYKLHDALSKIEVVTETNVVVTNDGITLQTEQRKTRWKFVSISCVNAHKLNPTTPKQKLPSLEAWLLDNPQSSFKSKKAFLEEAKQQITPIKEALLDETIRSLQPVLRDATIAPSEDFGIEGIVLLDPKTGKQVKIVDKGVFTLINQFNYFIRNQIKKTSRFNLQKYEGIYRQFDVSLGFEEESIYDMMLTGVADIVGIPSLGNYLYVTRTIKQFDDVSAFVSKWRVQDAHSLKTQLIPIIQDSIATLNTARERFVRDWKTYTLTLTSGREIRYTDEIYNRTLMVFAETQQEMNQILDGIQNSQSLTDIAESLFKKQLDSIR